MTPLSKGCIIFLNAFPGVGKLAIARAIHSKLDPERSRLIDNHLLIDPAEAIFPGRGEAHKALRSKIRQIAFDALKADSKPLTIIMTGCLGANREDAAVFAEHLEIARARKVPFFSFNITCDREEHRARFQDPARYQGSKTKLQDFEVLQSLLAKHNLLTPAARSGDCITQNENVDLHHLELDTTGMTAQKSANRIMELVGITA